MVFIFDDFDIRDGHWTFPLDFRQYLDHDYAPPIITQGVHYFDDGLLLEWLLWTEPRSDYTLDGVGVAGELTGDEDLGLGDGVLGD